MDQYKISSIERNILKNIGKAIQCYLNKKSISIQNIVDESQYSFKYLETLLSGNANPSFLTLLKISEMIEVDIDEIIEKAKNKHVEDELFLFTIWKFPCDSRSPGIFYKYIRATNIIDAIGRSKIKIGIELTHEIIHKQLTYPNIYFKDTEGMTYLIFKQ